MLFLGVVPTAIAYVLFARGLRGLDASEAATITLAEPVTAAALGVFVLGERVTGGGALGAVLVLGALVLLALRAGPAPHRAAGGRGGAGLMLARPSTAELLAADLRREILDGAPAAGERLRERELVERYGVARHTLRAALRQLAAEGLVRIEPHRGATVARLGPEDVRWLYELRAALELEAAHLALERHGGRLPERRPRRAGRARGRLRRAACGRGARSATRTRRCTPRSSPPPGARASWPRTPR